MTNLNVVGKQSHDRDTYEPCDAEAATELEQCANSEDSLDMLKQAGQETQAAKPEQAPWAVLSTMPTYNLQGMFITSVCSTLQEQNLGQPQCCIEAQQAQQGRRLLV